MDVIIPSTRESMAARLGQVLYWVACGIGALIAAFGLYMLMTEPEIDRGASVAMIGSGGAVWLIGRACLYVLAGR
jgi:hypothetical protein